MYEESIRIPMIVRYPKLVKPDTTVSEMVLNIDVAPTFLDLAGTPVPEHVQGASFKPLLQGRTLDWRDSFLYEYWLDLTPRIPDMVGVRTENWKLIRYPTIEAIDELYDLRNDPYEMHNLAEDPAYADRLAAMRAELERLKEKTDYRSRDPLPPAPPGELVLHYSFDTTEDNRVPDLSGKQNHGTVHGIEFVPGRSGQAAKFAGNGRIEVPNADSLNPAARDWTVEAWVEPEADGVILARGGRSLGYLLFVKENRPGFAVRSGAGLVVAYDTQPRQGEWTHLAGVITDGQVHLYVNGRKAASARLRRRIAKDQNDSMQIGADTGSPVDRDLSQTGFRGRLDELRIFSHALSDEAIAEHAGR